MMGDIQKRLLELIAERGWSIYRLAQEANIHQATVYSWFNNKKYTPSRKSLIPVSKRKIVFDFLSVIAEEASQK